MTQTKLTVAISSSALFDLTSSNAVFENEGVDAYSKYQIAHENDVLAPGVAFGLVKKFLNLNKLEPNVEVILLSRNSADTGLRIFNSIQHYGLNITRAAFCSGDEPYKYVNAFHSHLFLSADPQDTRRALRANCAAATIISPTSLNQNDKQLRLAFDGDAVLFSDDAQRVCEEEGLEAFAQSEKDAALEPLPAGPFKGFLEALHTIQRSFDPDECPIRTALVTARSAPAHERVIRTLRSWGIRLDEALFLGGMSKAEFLKAFCADIFFDDHPENCDLAKQHVVTGHVPHGVLNE